MADQAGLGHLEEGAVDPAGTRIVPELEWYAAARGSPPGGEAAFALDANAELSHRVSLRRAAAEPAVEPGHRHRKAAREIGVKVMHAARHVLRPGKLSIEAVARNDDAKVLSFNRLARGGFDESLELAGQPARLDYAGQVEHLATMPRTAGMRCGQHQKTSGEHDRESSLRPRPSQCPLHAQGGPIG